MFSFRLLDFSPSDIAFSRKKGRRRREIDNEREFILSWAAFIYHRNRRQFPAAKRWRKLNDWNARWIINNIADILGFLSGALGTRSRLIEIYLLSQRMRCLVCAISSRCLYRSRANNREVGVCRGDCKIAFKMTLQLSALHSSEVKFTLRLHRTIVLEERIYVNGRETIFSG